MLCHRKGHQKPDAALIGCFQKLCERSFFNGNVENQESSLFPEESDMNCPWEGEYKSIQASSMELDNTCSLDGSVPSNPFVLSQTMPWVPPQSDDFNLFSSGSGIDTSFHDQSIPRLSPKSSFQEEEFRPTLDCHSGNQSRAQVDSEFFEQTGPAQLCNSMSPFAPTALSPSSHFSHRDSGYEGMEKSPDCDTNVPPVSQAPHRGFQTASPDALLADQKAISHPELDQ